MRPIGRVSTGKEQQKRQPGKTNRILARYCSAMHATTPTMPCVAATPTDLQGLCRAVRLRRHLQVRRLGRCRWGGVGWGGMGRDEETVSGVGRAGDGGGVGLNRAQRNGLT